MTKKLFKYEIIEYLIKMFPYATIILALAVVIRIVQFFESDSPIYALIIRSAVGLYIAAVVISVIMVFVTAISKFYSGMFSNEGYLTHSLPITTAGKITAKLLAAVISVILIILFSGVTVFVATFGELAIEIIKAGVYLFKINLYYRGIVFLVIFFTAILLTIALITTDTLLFYACISLGQRSKSNKKMMAFFVFLSFLVICFLIVIGIMTASKASATVSNFVIYIYIGTIYSISVMVKVLPILTLMVAVFGTVCFYITHRSIAKNLNLG